MSANLDICPHCGKTVISGAMRCVGCGRTLKTREEQIASIQNSMQSKKKFDTGRLLKFIIWLLVIGIFFYFYSDQIVELINSILGE